MLRGEMEGGLRKGLCGGPEPAGTKPDKPEPVFPAREGQTQAGVWLGFGSRACVLRQP